MRGIQVKLVHTCEELDGLGTAEGANQAATRMEVGAGTARAPRYTHVPLGHKYTYVSKGFLIHE